MAVSIVVGRGFKMDQRQQPTRTNSPLCQMSGACLYELKTKEPRCQSTVGYSGCPNGKFENDDVNLTTLGGILK